ncbi:hypothetical protein ACX0G9_08005 [Flavitalea flava]
MIALIISLVALCTGIIAFIAAQEVIIDSNQRGIKRIKKPGWIFIYCTGALVFLPLIQYVLQNAADEKKETQKKIEQDKRDSNLRASYNVAILNIKKNFDTSNQKTVSLVSETLGKYGFKLDSANKKLIKKVVDSAKTKIILGDDPILQLSDAPKGIEFLKREINVNHYKITYESTDASSCCYEIKYSVVILDSLKGYKYINLQPANPPDYNLNLSKNQGESFFFHINDELTYNYLYVWVRGKYKNSDGSKSFTINKVYFNNINGNAFGFIQGNTRQKVIETVLKNEN